MKTRSKKLTWVKVAEEEQLFLIFLRTKRDGEPPKILVINRTATNTVILKIVSTVG